MTVPVPMIPLEPAPAAVWKDPAAIPTAAIEKKWVSKDRKEILRAFGRREDSRSPVIPL